MGTKYVNISISDMRSFLLGKGAKMEEKTQNEEIVFDFPHPSVRGLVIRIFTGISKVTEASRGCGQDALRVCCLDTRNGETRGYIKSHTAYRTHNWQFNLRDRTKTVIQLALERSKQPPFRLQGEKVNQKVYPNNNGVNNSNNNSNNYRTNNSNHFSNKALPNFPIRNFAQNNLDEETQKELQAELAAEMEIARIEGSQMQNSTK